MRQRARSAICTNWRGQRQKMTMAAPAIGSDLTDTLNGHSCSSSHLAVPWPFVSPMAPSPGFAPPDTAFTTSTKKAKSPTMRVT